jgi:hypothetical protein
LFKALFDRPRISLFRAAEKTLPGNRCRGLAQVFMARVSTRIDGIDTNVRVEANIRRIPLAEGIFLDSVLSRLSLKFRRIFDEIS